MSSGAKRKSDAEKATPEQLREASKVISPRDLSDLLGDIAAIDHGDGKAGLLGKVGPYKAYAMDFDSLRLHHDTDEGEGLVDGANFMATPKIVPKGRLYVDSVLPPNRRQSVLSHEGVETTLMDKHKWPYDKAHPIANHVEQVVMQHTQPGGQQPPVGTPPPAQTAGVTPPFMPKIGG